LIGSWPGVVPPEPNGWATVAFSPDGGQIAVGLASWPLSGPGPVDQRLLLLEAASGTIVWQRTYPMLPGQAEPQIAFTPSGTLVTSAEQGTTDLWDPRTGQITRRFPIGGRFALSPSGRLAAARAQQPERDQPDHLGDCARSGHARPTAPSGHPIGYLDGQLGLHSRRQDRGRRLPRRGRAGVGRPFGCAPADLRQAGNIPTPVFAPNGDLLILYDGTATEWPTGLAARQRFACQVAGRDLTPPERARSPT
jgi:hypothetical protein